MIECKGSWMVDDGGIVEGDVGRQLWWQGRDLVVGRKELEA